MAHYLEFSRLSKSFPGVKALEAVSFGVEQGSIHALVGENGAGKSTLLRILAGSCIADSGCIYLKGKEQHLFSPHEAIAAGISVIPQELALVPQQTVAENMTLGSYASCCKLVRWSKMFAMVESFLEKQGIFIDPRAKIEQLSLGQQQLIEIAKALYRKAKVIAFDEPSSSLSKAESQVLFTIIERLKQANKVVIYISHRLGEIFKICDSCTVLKDGEHVKTYSMGAKLPTSKELIQLMTGREINDVYAYRQRKISFPVLQCLRLSGSKIKQPVSLKIHRGEIVGLFGLIGAGRSEFARTLYGADTYSSGEVILPSYRCNSPHAAIQAGVMFCSEDRKKDGIINGRSIWENINISSRRHFSPFGVLLKRKIERQVAAEQVRNLAIKTPDLEQKIEYLSGGNQQKVILARWLSEKNMKVLIVDEPTRGIDVGSKYEIYNVLYGLGEQGVGIVFISSELEEVMGVVDRLYVMREGAVVKHFKRSEFSETAILEAAFPRADKMTRKRMYAEG